MLPPNLTRHYYETRRAALQAEGEEIAPWFRLTEQEQAAVELDVEFLRRAIRAAEKEQDLIASLTLKIPAGEKPEPVDDATDPQDCPCLRCSAVTALLKLMMKRTAERAETSTPGARRRGPCPSCSPALPSSFVLFC